MNTHKNARLTFARRQEMVQDMIEHRISANAATASAVHTTDIPNGYRRGRKSD